MTVYETLMDKATKLFEAAYRVARSSRGLGLDLSMVYELKAMALIKKAMGLSVEEAGKRA